MSSFDDLGLSPAIVEGLVAEGIDSPTPLQEQAIPALRRGTSVVLRASPGGGLLAAYGSAILDRLEAEGSQPRAIVLTQTRSEASALALSLARLAVSTPHRIGALGSGWALPERAHVLFAAASDLDRAVRSASVKLDAVEAVVVTQASALVQDGVTEALLSLMGGEEEAPVQVVLVADPVTDEIRSFADRHLRRAVFLPPEAGSSGAVDASVQRGRLRVRTVGGDVENLAARVVGELLAGEADHALVFVRSDAAAADVGDLLTLRGFLAGAPGDTDAPVWLGLEALEARAARDPADSERVAVVSLDVPADADELDRRHGGWSGTSMVLIRPREDAHLRRIAREAGYELDFETDTEPDEPSDIRTFLDRVDETIGTSDIGPYAVLLDPLFSKHGTTRVAAALARMLRTGTGSVPGDSDLRRDETPDVGPRPPAWVRLFVSAGRRDGIGAGDLLGAILGETGISSDQVGRIDLRDTFSRVDVESSVADTVIRKLNGTSIRSRSVRVDFDRGEGRSGSAGRDGESSRSGRKIRRPRRSDGTSDR